MHTRRPTRLQLWAAAHLRRLLLKTVVRGAKAVRWLEGR